MKICRQSVKTSHESCRFESGLLKLQTPSNCAEILHSEPKGGNATK